MSVCVFEGVCVQIANAALTVIEVQSSTRRSTKTVEIKIISLYKEIIYKQKLISSLLLWSNYFTVCVDNDRNNTHRRSYTHIHTPTHTRKFVISVIAEVKSGRTSRTLSRSVDQSVPMSCLCHLLCRLSFRVKQEFLCSGQRMEKFSSFNTQPDWMAHL